ncbi:NACHT, LRR and PYD domains-containing protein 3-like [Latimeria chalumnae]|uniref:NACHT, LRR and PYD domains-containing protein 3-like n=1 Tax=Latimeria chalumnae TaxID=7897 RepID=UPI00313BF85C
MDKTIKDILSDILSQLTEKENKKLKWKLQDIKVKDGYKNIPKGKLEKADECDLTDLLISYYPDGYAAEVMKNVLDTINKKDLAAKLHGVVQRGNLEQYQKHVQKKFGRIKAYNALPGQRRQLSSSYIRLLITERHFVRKEKKQFLQNVGTQDKEMMEKFTAGRYNCSNIEDLFKPDENGDSVTTVVLQGTPGIGKTFTAKKMIVDWALHEPYCGAFDYAFYLSCRELNQLSNSLSVADLIFEYCEILQPIKQEILKVPEKCLFIVDGFDELKFSMDVNEKDKKDTVWEKYPVEITVAKLFQRKVLSEATMVITTRPEAVDMLENKVEIDRFAEILGFSEEGRKEYFDTYFEDKSQALVVFDFIRKNDILFSMCYIPIICWVVCTVLKQHMDDEGDLTEGLKSATQVFVSYMNIILKHHHCKLGKLDDSLLQKLGALALNGVKEQKVLFDEKDLKKVSFSISEVPSSFLNMLLFDKDEDVQTVYNFAHLSFQEFLAALYCAKNDNSAEGLTLLQEFLHKEKSHLISTVRFLFGLRNQMIVSKLSFQPSTQTTSKMLDWIKMALGTHNGYKLLQLLYCLYEMHEEEFTTHAMKDVRILNLGGHCLKEIDCNVINYCVQHCRKIELNLSNCKVGAEGIKILLPALRKSLMLRWRLNASLLQDKPFLQQILRDIQDFLSFNKDTAPSKAVVWDALKDNIHGKLLSQASFLKKQSLGRIQTLEEEIRSLEQQFAITPTSALARDLQNKKYKLNTLLSHKAEFALLRTWQQYFEQGERTSRLLAHRLRKLTNAAKVTGIKTYTGVMVTAPKDICQRFTQFYKHLYSSEHPYDHSAVDIFFADLNLPTISDSDREDLDAPISILEITAAITAMPSVLQDLCLIFCEVLKMENWFVMGLIKIKGNGKKKKLLQKVTSKVQDDKERELSGTENMEPREPIKLGRCGLTAGCCEDLSSVLSTNSSLTELDLYNNYNLGDSGVKRLSAGLRDPNCKLQKLQLEQCGLTAGCCEDLSSVLSTNSSLTELNLYMNDLGDSGVKRLSAALRDPNCKLQKLVLMRCGLTAGCCEDLSSVLSTNSSLTELNLSWNKNLFDSGVKRLSAGLMDPNCKLQILVLERCGLTAGCCEDLSSVLSTNSSLTELHLSYNNLGDSGVKRLSAGLRDPNCKLQALCVYQNGLSPAMEAELGYF